ncbi:VTT domain-containing protein [Desulfobacterota bacterium]|nr:VTT domain-containing protein [Thermodesulfobacteriota bacterium]|tara:strand:- start:6472 stop:7056 length:585 start_codon:yes stop_codon:yes gene_type:complete
MIDKLYQYILQLCRGPRGQMIMSIVSFTEAVIFIIPPDPFLGLLCIKKTYKRIIKLVFLCLICSVAGGCLGYYLGEEIVAFGIKNDIALISNNIDKISIIREKFNDGTFLLMITSGFTPLPFKLFCVTAGVLNVDFLPFLVGSIIGRGLRFALIGYLAKVFEEQFDQMLKSKKLFYISISLILILIIYLIIKWI